MVADELACALAAEHVTPGARLLDPFCGSGRLLAAAETASLRVGFDVNPLALLLTRAKLANAQPEIVADILKVMQSRRSLTRSVTIDLANDRRVEWFSPGALRELGGLIAWINDLELPEPELLVVAAALSATAREVSFARQSGWKLHRLDSASREAFSACPWERFARRLRYCQRNLYSARSVVGSTRVQLADIRRFSHSVNSIEPEFDIVMTSPPYGDSRTTVQYGAASALCMSVVKSLKGFEEFGISGGIIDSRCLGGRHRKPTAEAAVEPYWRGSKASKEARLVDRFLGDYAECCDAIADNLVPGGKIVFVVGRRSVGGHCLDLDNFTADRFALRGFRLVSSVERALRSKRIPSRINRFARSNDWAIRKAGVTSTMTNEIILVMKKNTAVLN